MGMIRNLFRRLIGRSSNSSKRLISIVLLLKKPLDIPEADLRILFSSVLGVSLGTHPDDPSIFVQFRPGMFGIKTRGLRFGMMCIPQRYTRDTPANINDMDLRLRMAIEQHTAWVAIDAMDDTAADRIDHAYSLIGKLLAELIETDPANVLAAYSTQTGQLVYMNDELPEKLRGKTPLAAMDAPNPPVMQVAPGDPAMAAAVDQARQRWPEFTTAFAGRGVADVFSVKLRLTRGNTNEFMWVTPTEITDNQITGKLANEPALLKHLKIDDIVSAPVTDLNDWLYKTTGDVVGGFTVKVLLDRRKRHQ